MRNSANAGERCAQHLDRDPPRFALRGRARQHGRSTEAEIRATLDEAAVRPAKRMKLGSALPDLAKLFGGLDLRITRDKTPAQPVDLG